MRVWGRRVGRMRGSARVVIRLSCKEKTRPRPGPNNFGFLQRSFLVALTTAVAEVILEAEFRWKLGESVVGIHFDAPISATLLIRRLEGAVVSGTVEGEELVAAVAETLEGAVASVDDSVGATCFSAKLFASAEELLRDFDGPVENVADGTAKLTGGIVLRPGRCLDVGVGTAGQGEKGGDQDQFSHCWRSVCEDCGEWQLENRG